jgi:O-antigen/teichoic acid export membrane protein
LHHYLLIMPTNHVVTDAFWQILWRIASAVWWFIVITLITKYLWPLRFGDYSTILKYFAIWSALADFGVYVLALKHLWNLKKNSPELLQETYEKYVSSRIVLIGIVYIVALLIAYFIPAYTTNPFLLWWLPLWMVFSASFMIAWILQLPLQLHWKMKQVSIGLVIARVVQVLIISLVIWIFPEWYTHNAIQVTPFLLILLSVVLSGIAQWIYVLWQGNKYMKLRWRRDGVFTKSITVKNRKYWFAYYLSSFHTLLVIILLSFYFPTIEWFIYVGIWALALSLIEIFLIVPSALGNSLIHDVDTHNKESKLKRFGALMSFVVWIGAYIVLQFSFWRSSIIAFIWWENYLQSTIGSFGSDTVLPFLGIVLLLSFIKQVYNYIFVSAQVHNQLLRINGIWFLLWAIIGLLIIPKWNILGWIITQIILETAFVGGAWRYALKKDLTPIVRWRELIPALIGCILSIWLISKPALPQQPLRIFLWWWVLSTLLIVSIHYPLIKKRLRTLA